MIEYLALLDSNAKFGQLILQYSVWHGSGGIRREPKYSIRLIWMEDKSTDLFILFLNNKLTPYVILPITGKEIKLSSPQDSPALWSHQKAQKVLSKNNSSFDLGQMSAMLTSSTWKNKTEKLLHVETLTMHVEDVRS